MVYNDSGTGTEASRGAQPVGHGSDQHIDVGSLRVTVRPSDYYNDLQAYRNVVELGQTSSSPTDGAKGDALV